MENIYDFTMNELEDRLITKGYKKFNARQVFEWIYKKKVSKFEDMSNLSKKLREYLINELEILEVEFESFARKINDDFLHFRFINIIIVVVVFVEMLISHKNPYKI